MPGSRTPRQFKLAVMIIILSIFLFDVQGAIIKHLGQDYPVVQIMVFRNLFGLLPSILVLSLSGAWKQQGRPLTIKKWPLAVFRGAVLMSAQLSFYFSLTKLELATATTLAFAGPVFVTTLSVPLLGHRVGWVRTLAVLCGFMGVILVMQPGTTVFTVYLLLPVFAAFSYAITSLSSRFFDNEVPTALINAYSALFAAVGSGVLLLLTQTHVPVQSINDLGWLVLMGTVGGFAVLLLITAYRMCEPGSLSPFEYFGIPFSFILGYLFFAETPYDRLFPGAIFIVGGGLLVAWRESRPNTNSAND